MTLHNIVDRRKGSKYQFARIWGVVEPTWHDNSIKGSSQSPHDAAAPSCMDAGPDTFARILEWASSYPHAMTLYVYDSDPMAVRPKRGAARNKHLRERVQ